MECATNKMAARDFPRLRKVQSIKPTARRRLVSLIDHHPRIGMGLSRLSRRRPHDRNRHQINQRWERDLNGRTGKDVVFILLTDLPIRIDDNQHVIGAGRQANLQGQDHRFAAIVNRTRFQQGPPCGLR